MSFPIDETSWIDALPEAVKTDVFDAMTQTQLSKGQEIYTINSESLALYRVHSGKVIINHYAVNGKELIVGIVETGSCFGEMGLIDGLPRANNAYAQDTVQLQTLSKQEFWRLRKKHPEIADQLLLFVNHRLRLTHLEIVGASLMGLPQQLALRLHHLANRYYQKVPAGFEITLKISQEDLGKSFGVSRQSINKAVKILLESKVVTMKNGHFVVPDMETLKDFSSL